MILDAGGYEILPEAEVLKDNDILLVPGSMKENKDLVLKFAMGDRYSQTPEPQLERGLEFVKYLWLGKANEEIGGVLFLCFLDHMNWWTLDAYKNDKHDNADGNYSYRAGKLVMDWFFQNIESADELHTIHRRANHAATKVCERLGFKEKYLNPEFMIMHLRRKEWALTGYTTQ